MNIVQIYTDGACSGNPGPGGWAAVLICNGVEKELSGGEELTTNNQMELMAAIQGLNVLKYPCVVELYTDSTYLKNGITTWCKSWQKKNWLTAGGKPVKNQALWQQLLDASQQHQITWHWVKAHDGNELNERADSLARAAISK